MEGRKGFPVSVVRLGTPGGGVALLLLLLLLAWWLSATYDQTFPRRAAFPYNVSTSRRRHFWARKAVKRFHGEPFSTWKRFTVETFLGGSSWKRFPGASTVKRFCGAAARPETFRRRTSFWRSMGFRDYPQNVSTLKRFHGETFHRQRGNVREKSDTWKRLTWKRLETWKRLATSKRLHRRGNACLTVETFQNVSTSRRHRREPRRRKIKRPEGGCFFSSALGTSTWKRFCFPQTFPRRASIPGSLISRLASRWLSRETFPRRAGIGGPFPRRAVSQTFPRRAAAETFPRGLFRGDVETFRTFPHKRLDVETSVDVETLPETALRFDVSPSENRWKRFHVHTFAGNVSTS